MEGTIPILLSYGGWIIVMGVAGAIFVSVVLAIIYLEIKTRWEKDRNGC